MEDNFILMGVIFAIGILPFVIRVFRLIYKSLKLHKDVRLFIKDPLSICFILSVIANANYYYETYIESANAGFHSISVISLLMIPLCAFIYFGVYACIKAIVLSICNVFRKIAHF